MLTRRHAPAEPLTTSGAAYGVGVALEASDQALLEAMRTTAALIAGLDRR